MQYDSTNNEYIRVTGVSTTNSLPSLLRAKREKAQKKRRKNLENARHNVDYRHPGHPKIVVITTFQ